MKSILSGYVKKVRTDPVVRKRIWSITIVCALIMALMILRVPDDNSKYVYDDEGHLIALYRDDINSEETYSVGLDVGDEEDTRQYTIIMNDNTVAEDAVSERDEQEILQNAELSGIINAIETSRQKLTELPDHLDDGTKLSWREIEKSSYEWAYVLLLYVLLVAVAVVGTADRDKAEEEKLRYEIVRCVPRFTNQMLLLLNAGLIMNDAFDRVCAAYECVPGPKRRVFENKMIELREVNRDNQNTTSYLIGEFGARHNVKELVRLSAFMSENERKGSNIIESLDRESRYLWDERKTVAREKGRMIDTRMTYPLGLLLIMLIVITMAPALLTM